MPVQPSLCSNFRIFSLPPKETLYPLSSPFSLSLPAGGSVGKESACSVGDPGSTPGSGRSTGEGIGYQLQYSWASLVAQLVKNPPTMQETWVRSLGCEDPLEKGKANHSSILAWRIPWTVQSMGSERADMTEQLSESQPGTPWQPLIKNFEGLPNYFPK